MAASKFIDPTAEVAVSKITLERLKKYVATHIGSSLADSIEVRKRVEAGLEGMVYELRASVLASKIADDKYTAYFYYKVPATWFQHWKKDHAPRWFKKRYPVKYEVKKAKKTVHFKRYETYPQANLAIPQGQRTVDILGYNRPLLDIVEEY